MATTTCTRCQQEIARGDLIAFDATGMAHTLCKEGTAPITESHPMSERICKGCLKPIEPDATGATRYLAMMDLSGGPAESVHDDPDCKLRYQVRQEERKVRQAQATLARLMGRLQ